MIARHYLYSEHACKTGIGANYFTGRNFCAIIFQRC
jgi:hypothetical protein